MQPYPQPSRLLHALPLCLALITGVGAGAAWDEVRQTAPRGFAFEKEVRVPGSPEEVFDAFTGDVSGWWDHSFSGTPKALFIEPKPGGGFYEIFDEAGNGALHATVTRADRGKLLAFTGPLGLAALRAPVEMVHTLELTADGDDTLLTLSVAAMGELPEDMGGTVKRVWDHFLDEQFVPYVRNRSKR